MDQTMELLRVGVAEEDEIFRRGLIAVPMDQDWDCIVLATDGEANGKSADSAADLDVAVVCAKVLEGMRLPCPIVCLAADPQLYGADYCHTSANVKAILPHEHLSADELVTSVRAAVVGLQVESPGLSHQGDAIGCSSDPSPEAAGRGSRHAGDRSPAQALGANRQDARA
jgi:hypothetical protein